MDFEIYSRRISYESNVQRQADRLKKFLKPRIWRKLTSRLSSGTASDFSEDEDEDFTGLLEFMKNGWKEPTVRQKKNFSQYMYFS